MAANKDQQSQDVFLTPRVLNQQAFDDLAGTLRSLIDEANDSVDRLETQLAHIEQRQQQPAQASAQLQERLRLGARMLKAFQTQIDRVEAGLGRLGDAHVRAKSAGEQLQEHLQTFDAEAAESLARAEHHLNAQVDAAKRKLDEHLADQPIQAPDVDELEASLNNLAQRAIEQVRSSIDQQLSRIEDIDDVEKRINKAAQDAVERIDARAAKSRSAIEAMEEPVKRMQQRADELAESLGALENRAETISRHAEDAMRQVDHRVASAGEIVRQCGEARGMLDEALLGATERIDELSAVCDVLSASIRNRLEEGKTAEQRFSKSVDNMMRAAEKVEPGAEICQRMEMLLDRLAPWEKLLLRTERTPDGMPKPVASMIEGLRASIGQDMARLSLTMRELAQRADEFVPPTSVSDAEALAGDTQRLEVVTTVHKTSEQQTDDELS